jgi:hypothetical protein
METNKKMNMMKNQDYQKLLEKLIDTDNQVKSQVLSLNERIRNQHEFMTSEIEVTIESFKIKLDDICLTLKKKLDESRDTMQAFVQEQMPNSEELENRINTMIRHMDNNQYDLKIYKQSEYLLASCAAKLEGFKNFNFKVR